ncbi:MAG: hypothetical protein KDL87_01015 [Verrucomicrobiae bacterium]|nr:hypothetical protein [Verrucomicrobiae bacterium]
MSASSLGDKQKSRVTLFACLAGLAWLGLLAVLWWQKPAEGGHPNDWWIFLGRFHPLIVHVPIGLLLIVPVLEILGRWPGRAYLRDSVPLLLWLTALGTIGSTVAGYLLMEGEQIESDLMTRHLWSGIIFGALAFLTLILRLRSQGLLYLGSLGFSIVVLSLAGHYGGALVHGPTYLAKHAPDFLKPLMMAGLGDHSVTKPEIPEPKPDQPGGEPPEVPLTDRLVFNDFVLPIMEAKCTECHNENKTKGKLRLDTHEVILAGAEGSDVPTVKAGNSEESELIVRVLLPSDDDDFMPPDGKDPLTPEEIKIVRWWIDKGAAMDATVGSLAPDESMTQALAAVGAALSGAAGAGATEVAEDGAEAPSEWDRLSPEEKQERLAAVQAAAEHFHFSVMPVSAEDDRLKVNVVNASKEFGDEQLAVLVPVAERIVWLDLGRSQITDAGMKTVGKMRNLERLHLENTRVTDAGLAEVAKLPKLEYLNLYGTAVTSAIFEPLAKLKGLRKLYLWQTKVDPGAARAFQRSMSLEVNIGTELENPPKPEPERPIVGEPEKKPEPKKDDPKKPEPKKEEPKKDAPKPAAPEAKKETPKPANPAPAKPAPAEPKKAAPEAKKETPPTTPAPKPATPPAPAPKTATEKPKA